MFHSHSKRYWKSLVWKLSKWFLFWPDFSKACIFCLMSYIVFPLPPTPLMHMLQLFLPDSHSVIKVLLNNYMTNSVTSSPWLKWYHLPTLTNYKPISNCSQIAQFFPKALLSLSWQNIFSIYLACLVVFTSSISSNYSSLRAFKKSCFAYQCIPSLKQCLVHVDNIVVYVQLLSDFCNPTGCVVTGYSPVHRIF